MKYNLLLDKDAYKDSHIFFQDKDITYDNRYFESRGGMFDKTYFFGLQYVIQAYLCKPITQEDLDEAFPILENTGTGYNREGWQYIVDRHGGKLPIEICAVKEGTIIGTGNVLFQIRNTDPNCAWLVGIVETMLMRVWYPTTVATLSYHIREMIQEYADISSDIGFIDYHLNDFGSRGCSSFETSAIGGAAHLCIFAGSDNIPGLKLLKDYYGHKSKQPISVKATEHSIMCQRGRDGEYEVVKNIVLAYPDEITSMVIDAYNDLELLDYLGTELKEHIVKRTAPLVVRPDSGSPIEAISMCFDILSQHFGFIVNSKGYKVLPDYVRIIQGDGINYESIQAILKYLEFEKISIDNVIFGMGGHLLQNVGRDDLRFAIKSSQIIYKDGSKRDIFKDPIGDKGKRSKSGRLALGYDVENRKYFTTTEDDPRVKDEYYSILDVVFRNGVCYNTVTHGDIKVYE